VESARQGELNPAEDHHRKAAVDERRDHQPAEPDLVAEQHHGADRWMLKGDQFQQRVEQ
jgi:hypothetical protein